MYTLRFFFDYDGTCLWADNDAARERFGYAVDLSDLPLPDALRADLEQACRRFDTRLNWDDPAGPLRWSEQESRQFNLQTDELLSRLRDALGSSFVVRDARDATG